MRKDLVRCMAYSCGEPRRPKRNGSLNAYRASQSGGEEILHLRSLPKLIDALAHVFGWIRLSFDARNISADPDCDAFECREPHSTGRTSVLETSQCVRPVRLVEQ